LFEEEKMDGADVTPRQDQDQNGTNKQRCNSCPTQNRVRTLDGPDKPGMDRVSWVGLG